MIPARRSWILDDSEPQGLNVFVPGAMGVGVLLSLGIAIADGIRNAGGRRLVQRRVGLTARAIAADVLAGTGGRMASELRGPWAYTAVTAVSVGLATFLAIGSTWSYVDPTGSVRGIAWIWALGLLAAGSFALVGVATAQAVPGFLPIVLGAAGGGSTVWFTNVVEGIDRAAVLGIGTLGVTTLTACLVGLRTRSPARLPAWAWPLFASTPLAGNAAGAEAASSPRIVERDAPWIRRYRREGARLVLAAGVVVGTAAMLSDPPAGWETAIFRAVNGLPHGLHPLVWQAAQEVGSAPMVPLAAAVLWLLVKDWRPPVALMGSSILIGWLAAEGVRHVLDRGRPDVLVDGTQLEIVAPVVGVGFLSGHAIAVLMVATVLSPYVHSKGRWILYGAGVLVVMARMYVGAHMPLDVIGGAALGIVAGSAVNLATGIRADVATTWNGIPLTFQSEGRRTVVPRRQEAVDA